MGNTILLADKSITIQKIVQLTFADDNYTIQCVSDGQAAIDAIPKVHPDLILADISLPLRTGYDVCRTLRTEASLSPYAATPVILLAGIYETMDEERARQVEERVKEVNANDFLSKPFDPQVLIAKVKQYMKPAVAEPMPQPVEPENIFAAAAETAENMFAGSESPEFQSAEPPPDDGERTMMIPGGVSFGENMFAEPLPYEEEAPEAPKRPLDIDAIKPVGEPVFGEEGEEFSESDYESETGTTIKAEAPRFEPLESYDPSASSESVFPEEAHPAIDALPLIMPAEEPFGEVFDEPSPAAEYIAPAVLEEDTPFGLPPAAEPEPEPLVAEEAPEAEPLQEPVVEQEAVAAASPGEEEVEYEDTWPGVPISRAEQPVEELFEAEPALTSGPVPLEEAEELQPDLSESAAEPEAEVVVAPQPTTDITAPVALASGPVEITDELVEKIAERVVAKLSERFVSEIVWQVVPDLAEKMIRRELEKLHAGED